MEIDLRLIEIEMELSTLQTHIEMIEEQVKQGEEVAKCELHDKWQELRKLNCADRTEWDILHQERDLQVDFVLPRVLRVPFLVTLFTVYEAAVTEIASHVQKEKGLQISIDDLKGSLLDRAKKYYSNVIELRLSTDNQHWQRIKLLSDLRNAIVHTNGRLDLMSSKRKKKILKNDGVSEYWGCIVVDANFLRESFAIIKEELEELMDRYKQRDTTNRAS